MLSIYGMPIKGAGDDGDAMLWAGLMTAVGDPRPLVGVKMCQTDDGRVWRSPSLVNNQPQNSFSRDMSLGFILYCQATKDTERGNKWVDYIHKTGGLFPANEATDNRYLLSPSGWWLMSYAGISVPWYYRYSRWMLKSWMKIEARTTPKGFARHLCGVSILILSLAWGERQKDLGEILHAKEPLNPFFAWLAGKDVLATFLYKDFKTRWQQNPGDGSQWAWERTDSEEAWKDSMGWDFLFLEKLFQLSI